MNREILFRGKRCDNKKWVEGYLMDEDCINTPINDGDACGRFDDPVEIDPSTVCQYTGLTDRNGRKIFEGDILSAHLDDSYPDDITYVQVLWSGFSWCVRENTEDDVIEKADGQIWEVCGNIFDNPELIN